jgi:hypothetical protein
VRQHILDFQTEHELKPKNGGSDGKLNCHQTDALLIHLRG